MKKAFEIRGRVQGTPRTYGDSRTEDAWRRAVVGGLWAGHESVSLPLDCEVELQFNFAIHAASADYGGAPHPNGRDLDTLVVQSSTSAALVAGRNTERPSLRWIGDPRLVQRVIASKRLVASDKEAGVEILIRPPATEPMPAPGKRVLDFEVSEGDRRSLGLVEAVKRAVAVSNQGALRFPSSSRISLFLTFSAARRQINLLSEELLEKTIDALGASPVGNRRLFDEVPGRQPGRFNNTDDSIVFELQAEKVEALPGELAIQGEVWQVPTP